MLKGVATGQYPSLHPQKQHAHHHVSRQKRVIHAGIHAQIHPVIHAGVHAQIHVRGHVSGRVLHAILHAVHASIVTPQKIRANREL